MRKTILFILTTFLLSFSTIHAESTIYNKIDSIYNKSPEKLEVINNKINILLLKNYNKKTKDSLIGMKDYIDYKLKNKDFYNKKVSGKTKILINNIYDKSFTDQEILKNLNNLYNNNSLSFIDIEYLNYHILKSNVSILLNHQKFVEAEEITKNYFKLNDGYDNNKLYFIAKNVSYDSFGLLTQLIGWINPDKQGEIIQLRTIYFPNENNSAYNIARRSGYKEVDCEKLDIIDKNLDILDQLHCKLQNGKFDLEDIKKSEQLNNNIQNLSDRLNYYSYVGLYYPNIREDMNIRIKILGEKIIEKDKNFINGYLGLLDYFNYKQDCVNFNMYAKMMFENYIGDESRKSIFTNREYDFCSLKE